MTKEDFVIKLKESFSGQSFYTLEDCCLDFCEIFLKPSCENITTNIPNIIFVELDVDKGGYYNRQSNTIGINRTNISNIISSIKNGDIFTINHGYVYTKGLLNAIIVLIHEWRHFLQNELIIDNKFESLTSEKISKIFDNAKIKELIDYRITRVLEVHENKETIKNQLKFLSEVDFENRKIYNSYKSITDFIEFYQYINRMVEKDARNYSIEIFEKIIKDLINDGLLNVQEDFVLLELITQVYNENIEREKEYSNNKKKLDEFNEFLKNINMDDIYNYIGNTNIIEIKNLIKLYNKKERKIDDVKIKKIDKNLTIAKDFNSDIVNILTTVDQSLIQRREVLKHVFFAYFDNILLKLKVSNYEYILKDIYRRMLLNGDNETINMLRDYVKRIPNNIYLLDYFSVDNTENIFNDDLIHSNELNSRTFDAIQFIDTFPIDTYIKNGQIKYAERMISNVSIDDIEKLKISLTSVQNKVEALQFDFQNNKKILFDELLKFMRNLGECYKLPPVMEYFEQNGISNSIFLNKINTEIIHEIKLTIFNDKNINMQIKNDLNMTDLKDERKMCVDEYIKLILMLEQLCYLYIENFKKSRNGLTFKDYEYRFGNFEDKEMFLLPEFESKLRMQKIYGDCEALTNEFIDEMVKSQK